MWWYKALKLGSVQNLSLDNIFTSKQIFEDAADVMHIGPSYLSCVLGIFVPFFSSFDRLRIP